MTEVGLTWESPRGVREIVSEGIRAGTSYYAISTAGSAQLELVRADEIQSEIRRDQKNYESRSRARQQTEESTRAESARSSWYGFTDSMNPTGRARADVVLRKQMSFDGKLAARGDEIAERVRSGWAVDAGKLVSPSGSYLLEKDITKIGLDFARYLARGVQMPNGMPSLSTIQERLMHRLCAAAGPSTQTDSGWVSVSGEHPRGGEYDCATSLRKLGLVEIVLHPRALARLTAAGRAWCVAHLTPNSESYYVWPLRTDGTPLESEGPYGPHDLEGAKTYARIAATEGKHDRAVSRGIDPTTPSFEIVRRYKAGTGNRVI